MKTLYLLRHAQAEPPGRAAGDFERPLSSAGRAAAQRLADVMVTRGWRPQAVLCSPAYRAQETWEAMAPKLALDAVPTFPRILYLAPPHQLLTILRQQSGDGTSTLLVAHNPGIHRLALSLASPRSANAAVARPWIDYPPAGLSVFELDIDTWQDLGSRTSALAAFVGPDEFR